MAEGYYCIGPDWRIRYANGPAAAFWGKPRDALVGHSMLELFPHFAGSPSHAAHRRAMATGEAATTEAISTATGAPVELRLYPSAEGLSVYFLDISQRRRLEEDLRTREELLTLAELSAGIGVWVQDLATGTMTATPQFFRLLGIAPIEGPVAQDYIRSFRRPADRERRRPGGGRADAGECARRRGRDPIRHRRARMDRAASGRTHQNGAARHRDLIPFSQALQKNHAGVRRFWRRSLVVLL